MYIVGRPATLFPGGLCAIGQQTTRMDVLHALHSFRRLRSFVRCVHQVKSSVRMLEVFCQFLHGEGDFVRHLKKMGYVVGHVQSYIGESGGRGVSRSLRGKPVC